MHKTTGEKVTGLAYLQQRFFDVMRTQVGSLVGDRDYGSDTDDLVDENITPGLLMIIFSRTAQAIKKPINGLLDFKLKKLRVSEPKPNTLEVIVIGDYLGDEVQLSTGALVGSYE